MTDLTWFWLGFMFFGVVMTVTGWFMMRAGDARQADD